VALRREELEAALAHELAHVRRRDVLVQTLVVLFATTLVELSRVGGWFSRALLYVFAPIGAAFVHVLCSTRESERTSWP
jgi:Zn-dependent protease with chaperone function